MAKREINTDLWVYELLKEADITISAQGCDIHEINEALKSASKSQTGRCGYPEYCGVVKDFILVIEDKASLDRHIYKDDKGLLAQDVRSVKDYAVNGALFYALHLAANTTYSKVLAFGVSGNEKHHRITPLFVDDRGDYQELPDVETFISFNEANIGEYYYKEILHEATDVEKTTAEILKDAEKLHNDLRNYGNLTTEQKPLIVSGIMLALREIEHKTFSIDFLNGDTVVTDGQKIYEAIKSNLYRADVSPDTKRDKLLGQFSVIRDTTKINEKDDTLGKTPLRHYTEFLYNSIYKNIRYHSSAEDYLGRFYGEFMFYSGGDGQTLGIVLTPKHITELFCDLAQLRPEDKVFDPCCGTAGFLIAAMHRMTGQADDEALRRSIRRNQLFGIELQSYMFTIATTNMILRGDGKSNLQNLDFLRQNTSQLQLKGCTVGMMNPPYSQGSKGNPELYEISFTEHLLDSLVEGARAVVIIPQSSVTGKSREEQNIKENILRHHTLEGVITLNKNTFYRVGTNPCIAVFTAGIPHDKNHLCKFINFEDDGFVVSKHVGLEETASARDKRQHLLDVWFGRLEAETRFCVETTIEAQDEWLHAFYYFNDEIPAEKDFETTMADYLTFEFNMIAHGRGYLFENLKDRSHAESAVSLESREWKEFFLEDAIVIDSGKRLVKQDMQAGLTPFIGASEMNNGITAFTGSKNDSLDKNVLGVNYNGSVGFSFYHPYEALFSDDVKRVKWIDTVRNNQYTLLFLSSMIRQQKNKFAYGYKFNAQRMKRQKILLPVCAEGAIDWQFMEDYMGRIERRILKSFAERLSTQLN